MIREAALSDLPTLLRLRTKLWPDCVGKANVVELIQILQFGSSDVAGALGGHISRQSHL